MMNLLKNKFVIGIAVIALAALAWWGLAGSSAPTPLLTTETSTTASDAELVITLLQLRAVTLSGTIFTDPAFMSLKDFGKEIVPEPVGRSNPFAPLPSSAKPTENTTQGAQIFRNSARIFAPTAGQQ